MAQFIEILIENKSQGKVVNLPILKINKSPKKVSKTIKSFRKDC